MVETQKNSFFIMFTGKFLFACSYERSWDTESAVGLLNALKKIKKRGIVKVEKVTFGQIKFEMRKLFLNCDVWKEEGKN